MQPQNADPIPRTRTKNPPEELEKEQPTTQKLHPPTKSPNPPATLHTKADTITRHPTIRIPTVPRRINRPKRGQNTAMYAEQVTNIIGDKGCYST